MGASRARDGRNAVSLAEVREELGIRTVRVRNAWRMGTLGLRMGLPDQEAGGDDKLLGPGQGRTKWEWGFTLPYVGQLLVAGPRS